MEQRPAACLNVASCRVCDLRSSKPFFIFMASDGLQETHGSFGSNSLHLGGATSPKACRGKREASHQLEPGAAATSHERAPREPVPWIVFLGRGFRILEVSQFVVTAVLGLGSHTAGAPLRASCASPELGTRLFSCRRQQVKLSLLPHPYPTCLDSSSPKPRPADSAVARRLSASAPLALPNVVTSVGSFHKSFWGLCDFGIRFWALSFGRHQFPYSCFILLPTALSLFCKQGSLLCPMAAVTVLQTMPEQRCCWSSLEYGVAMLRRKDHQRAEHGERGMS